jgi:hypothetical protein
MCLRNKYFPDMPLLLLFVKMGISEKESGIFVRININEKKKKGIFVRININEKKKKKNFVRMGISGKEELSGCGKWSKPLWFDESMFLHQVV